MKHYLVTGGAGFIGANFVEHFLKTYPDRALVNLDKLTYAGDLANLTKASKAKNYHFIQGDICDRALIESLFEKHAFEGVYHFAAESHVDNSIAGPQVFMETNVMGSFTLIDVARKFWMEGPFQAKPEHANARFLHISTDEVYGTLGEEGLFTETTPYAPNSPYSASKAASDMIIRSYHHTYGMNTVITNCSNNYGPKQHKEKLIPTILRKALALEPIPIYGKGENIRDWLFVLDHCKGIDLAFSKGKSGETYNIGGRNERNNLFIAQYICQLLDTLRPRGDGQSYDRLIEFVKDRPGHDLRYAIDASKIETQLGWKADENFETGIQKTLEWYLAQWN